MDRYVLAFVAGLVGGAHCLGMCGGLVLAAAAGGQRAWLFHLGRLTGYAVLGAAAGVAGALLDLAGGAAGLHRLRFLVSGALLVAFGLAFVGLLPRRWLEGGAGLGAAALRRARGRGRGGAFVLGLPFGLLPCGLLYPMYAAAAGSGSAAAGALLLFAFGLGTVPLLGTVSFALERLALATRQRLVRVAGVAMLLMGALLVAQAAGAGGPGAHHPMP